MTITFGRALMILGRGHGISRFRGNEEAVATIHIRFSGDHLGGDYLVTLLHGVQDILK